MALSRTHLTGIRLFVFFAINYSKFPLIILRKQQKVNAQISLAIIVCKYKVRNEPHQPCENIYRVMGVHVGAPHVDPSDTDQTLHVH